MSTQERRVAPRFEIQAPVEYQPASVEGHGLTEKVSRSGVRIERASSIHPIGTELWMRFSFFLSSFETKFSGNVVRHTDGGFAVQFGEMDEARREVLQRAFLPGQER